MSLALQQPPFSAAPQQPAPFAGGDNRPAGGPALPAVAVPPGTTMPPVATNQVQQQPTSLEQLPGVGQLLGSAQQPQQYAQQQPQFASQGTVLPPLQPQPAQQQPAQQQPAQQQPAQQQPAQQQPLQFTPGGPAGPVSFQTQSHNPLIDSFIGKGYIQAGEYTSDEQLTQALIDDINSVKTTATMQAAAVAQNGSPVQPSQPSQPDPMLQTARQLQASGLLKKDANGLWSAPDNRMDLFQYATALNTDQFRRDEQLSKLTSDFPGYLRQHGDTVRELLQDEIAEINRIKQDLQSQRMATPSYEESQWFNAHQDRLQTTDANGNRVFTAAGNVFQRTWENAQRQGISDRVELFRIASAAAEPVLPFSGNGVQQPQQPNQQQTFLQAAASQTPQQGFAPMNGVTQNLSSMGAPPQAQIPVDGSGWPDMSAMIQQAAVSSMQPVSQF